MYNIYELCNILELHKLYMFKGRVYVHLHEYYTVHEYYTFLDSHRKQ